LIQKPQNLPFSVCLFSLVRIYNPGPNYPEFLTPKPGKPSLNIMRFFQGLQIPVTMVVDYKSRPVKEKEKDINAPLAGLYYYFT
jgi:hypothetical protein